MADRVSFEVAGASEIPGVDGGYDLVTYFDCLHDMGDPLGALRRAREVLAEGGVVMIVEPMAGERVEENFNPIGRAYSAGSAMLCTPNALATGGNGLGTIATEAEIRAVAEAAGFGRFRRATETPFEPDLRGPAVGNAGLVEGRNEARTARCGPGLVSPLWGG